MQPPIDELINALTPPRVPSLSCARSLAFRLTTESPLPRLSFLNPILDSLCAASSPVHLQAAGYDILSAYWENHEASSLSTADRLAYFSFFLTPIPSVLWSPDLWESRFKALRSLTKRGREIVGIEAQFINVLKLWIQSAFDGLLDDPLELERERSVELLADFLFSTIDSRDIFARIPEHELSDVLRFYAGLFDRFLGSSSNLDPPMTVSPPPTDTVSGPFTRPVHTHKRHPSSLSITSSQTPAIPTPKRPADIALLLYLKHLQAQLKTISQESLTHILPLLFRALAYYATPLPRLSVVTRTHSMSLPEERVTDVLDALFVGPYSASCMVILKQYLSPPPLPLLTSMQIPIQISIGAHRTLRTYIRKRLSTRLARAYISRETSIGYAPSGAPGHMDVERELMEAAWPKEDVGGWDAGRLGRLLSSSVKVWIECEFTRDGVMQLAIEQILDEAAGTLKDVLQELDSREDSVVLDQEEASAIGETLHQLTTYIPRLRNNDNAPFIVPLSQPMDAPTPFLRTLSSLLSRDHVTSLSPLLSTTLLSLANHLTDADTSKLPLVMIEQHDLSPTSPEWLGNWHVLLLGSPTLLASSRPLTRGAIMKALQSVYSSIKDMPAYRKPLGELVWKLCQQRLTYADHDEVDTEVIWRILSDEIVLRTVENDSIDAVDCFIDFLATVAAEGDSDSDDDTASVVITDTPSPSLASSNITATLVSPGLSRQAESQGAGKDKDSNIPTVMSLLTSLASGPASRSQSRHPLPLDSGPETPTSLPPVESPFARATAAVVALVTVFTQLSFTPYATSAKNIELAVRVYRILIKLLMQCKSPKSRLTIVQFLMRLRADRDHQLYYVDEGYDPDNHIMGLASLIHRVCESPPSRLPRNEAMNDNASGEYRRARAHTPQMRDGRRFSRGRGIRSSHSEASRSRSRTTNNLKSAFLNKSPEILWQFPEILPFVGVPVDSPSESLISYDPEYLGHRIVLPISEYLSAIVEILEHEQNWDILSYVLCHLPVQLANKHLFCGPKSRLGLVRILTTLCTGMLNGELASEVDCWPMGLKARDAHGLAYHTLSVLISYQRCFDVHQKHVLVEVFQTGLNGQPSTIKCCLHALSLSAFELQSSMTKYLSSILEKLSQIMSNPDMAVHILGFLSIVGSLRSLHANFRDGDFKMVFGVALQYLQHHNRLGLSPAISWALSQHVRILSYYLLYVWFLAVRLPDRPKHVRFITRQLLLANDGNAEVDDPTEVCFDWLARYAYASADPRPANSLLSDVVSNPTAHGPPSEVNEKAWILGNSVVTVRTLSKLGWIEVLSRRPSGFTKFLCRVENVPMVRSGDVDPDLMSGPSSLLMERECPKAPAPDGVLRSNQSNVSDIFASDEASQTLPRPDSTSGYVWSGIAPSQRRKEVSIDPAYFPLQLSAYPSYLSTPYLRRIVDTTALPGFFRTLDRIPVIDTHKVGIMYVAPGQTQEREILGNSHGSPAYTRFLEGIGRLINLREQGDVYAGGLNPDEDGEYAYAWWDDIGQILYHTATMMPSHLEDEYSINKKRHIGNDYVRIIWNDSGMTYAFNTLTTQFQFVNIVIEPHSLGAIAAFSNNIHENEYFKITIQQAPGMTEFTPVGEFKLISAENLPLLVRQLSLLADWFASIFERTECDTARIEMTTNWHARLQTIKRFKKQLPALDVPHSLDGIMDQEAFRDFTTTF